MVEDETIVSDIFETFYDFLKERVKEVELSDGSIVAIQTYTAAFPDYDIDRKEKYPILVIGTPIIEWKPITFQKYSATGTISISIFCTKAEACDKFANLINDSIKKEQDYFNSKNLYQVELDSFDTDEFLREKMKIHVRILTFKFVYDFKR